MPTGLRAGGIWGGGGVANDVNTRNTNIHRKSQDANQTARNIQLTMKQESRAVILSLIMYVVYMRARG